MKGLARWMKEKGVERVNLSYFGTAHPDYYGIDARCLPGSPWFLADRVGEPELPGYVAVSVTNLVGVYLSDLWRERYRRLLEREPVAVIGHSIHVYRLEREWW